MVVKTKKHFNEIVRKLTLEIVEDELDEVTSSGDIDGYMTPMAFTGGKGKKKNKKISTNSTGYELIDESLDNNDMKKIKKLIRDVVANILRDIWLKRSTWKNTKN